MSEKIVEYETKVKKFDERHQPADLPVLSDNSPAALMQIAMSKGMDLDKLEKMLELQCQWEERESKKAYISAISNFKKKPLEILKDKKVSFKTQKGETEYSHASLANVVNTVSAELGNHGLSASWKTEQGDFGVKVTCILTHSGGHSEEVSLTAAPDTSGVKNQIQSIASTVSYLERYTLLAITGLATKDMDNDGKGAAVAPEYITVDMQTEINDLIKSTKSDKAVFLEYIQVKSIEKIPLSEYGKVKIAFAAKVEAAEKEVPELGSAG